MEIAKCKCGYKLEKPKWEHLIYAIYEDGGYAGKGKCPHCKKETLEFYFRAGNYMRVKLLDTTKLLEELGFIKGETYSVIDTEIEQGGKFYLVKSNKGIKEWIHELLIKV